MKLNKLVAIVVIAGVACAAFAQGGGQGRRGGGQGPNYSPMTLVGMTEVQTEINLTEDQKTKLTELRTSTRTKMTEARQNASGDQAAIREATQKINADATKSLMEILTADQAKRLRELQIQWTGVRIVLTDKEAQTELGITEDQKAKLKDLQERQQKANAELREKQQSGEIDAAQARETRTKNEKILDDEISKVLTEDQKTKLTAMGGKPMPKPAMQAGRRGRGGGL